MNNAEEIVSLKTEIKRLKIRIRRIEDFFLSIPSAKEYIHENNSPDELFEEAKEVVQQYKRASASLIQRRLSIGYSRAARILDQLEEAKIVGPAKGSEPRKVLISNKEKANYKSK